MTLDYVNAVLSDHAGVDQWNTLFNQHGAQFHVPPNLAKAICLYESGGNQQALNLRDGGSGLMQITYAVDHPNGYGSPPHLYQGRDIMEPDYNVAVACRDFIAPATQAFAGDLDAIIASYNAGIPRVQRAVENGEDLTTITYKPWYVPNVRNAYLWFVRDARTLHAPAFRDDGTRATMSTGFEAFADLRRRFSAVVHATAMQTSDGLGADVRGQSQ